MIRRDALLTVVALLAVPLSALAQNVPKIPRIGFMRGERPPQAYLDAFESGLRKQGFIAGQNVRVEYRFPAAGATELPRIANELVASKVDIIVAAGALATRAARGATSVIPIVMSPATDPVGNGFVASLPRPGGNITGISLFNWELIGKRVELLREILPGAARVAVLFNPDSPAPTDAWDKSVAAASSIGVNLKRIEVRAARDFVSAFAVIAREQVEGLIVVQATLFDTPPYRIVQLAAANRIPTVYGLRLPVEAGGLVSYGPNVGDLYAQAAAFVAKILRGVKPRDLPVEQPIRIELVINLKPARELGLVIPQSLLLRADEIIR
jgi:putative ABC transport system substrate-binding protein